MLLEIFILRATTLFDVSGATMLFVESGATTPVVVNGATRVFVIPGTPRPLGSPELPFPGVPGVEFRLSARKLLDAVGTDVVRPNGGLLAAAVPVGPF